MTTGMKMTMLVMIMMKQIRSLTKESQSEEVAAGTEKGDKGIAVEAKLKRLRSKLHTAILNIYKICSSVLTGSSTSKRTRDVLVCASIWF